MKRQAYGFHDTEFFKPKIRALHEAITLLPEKYFIYLKRERVIVNSSEHPMTLSMGKCSVFIPSPSWAERALIPVSCGESRSILPRQPPKKGLACRGPTFSAFVSRHSGSRAIKVMNKSVCQVP